MRFLFLELDLDLDRVSCFFRLIYDDLDLLDLFFVLEPERDLDPELEDFGEELRLSFFVWSCLCSFDRDLELNLKKEHLVASKSDSESFLVITFMRASKTIVFLPKIIGGISKLKKFG